MGELPATYVEGFHDKEAVLRMPYRVLGKTGLSVSIISLGASSLGSVFHATNEEECIELVKEAVRSGINYIDVAPFYGQTKAETVLGKALKVIPRQAYYLTTKVCRYGATPEDMFDFSYERAVKSVDESLARLNVDCIDILQVHDMEFAPSLDIVLNESLPAVAAIKAAGKCKFIGITGYPMDNFRNVIEKSKVPIDSILTYCRYSLNDTSLLGLLDFLVERGIGIVNASPISMGLLSNRGPPEWHPATEEIRVACKAAAEYCSERGIDIAKLAMAFSLAHTTISTTLVSTSSIANLRRNLAAVTAVLTEDEKAAMEHVRKEIFDKLSSPHWEQKEVDKYWEQRGGKPQST
eukprot:scpid55357/ scgid24366/ D-arabinose 1-dehydrogenase; NAD(+)-specific D-arabinose dehydrogenase